MALCFTESSLNYNVKHHGRYDSGTKGICGIKPCWNELLDGVDRNSLQAGSIVISHLLETHSLDKALHKYKGAKKSHKEVNSVKQKLKDIER